MIWEKLGFLVAMLDFAGKKMMFSRLDFLYVILETFLVINPKKKLLLQFVVG